MSDTHADDIWQRKSARQIMKEARKRFRELEAVGDYAGASTQLGSVHYSLIKRYLSPEPIWVRFLAVWHMWRAVFHAHRVSFGLMPRTFNQVDVVTTILSKAPKWLGGDVETAHALALSAFAMPWLYEGEMSLHTRALLLIRLGELGLEVKKKQTPWEVESNYSQALDIATAVSDQQQLCRILSSVGFFYVDYPELGKRDQGIDNLEYALAIAYAVSKDQEGKILGECRKRGIDLPHPVFAKKFRIPNV